MDLALDLRIWVLVLSVSAISTLVTLSYYFVGQKGFDVFRENIGHVDVDAERWQRAQAWYSEHGPPVLFFSFVPMLGVLLEAAAGAFGIRVPTYIKWVLLGRLVRNCLILLTLDLVV
jgi:membrane protein YqaA with SNARE-associated domain